jgi:hypothetical protein
MVAKTRLQDQDSTTPDSGEHFYEDVIFHSLRDTDIDRVKEGDAVDVDSEK